MPSTSAESSAVGPVTIEAGGGGFAPSGPPIPGHSPYWRFILADLETGAPISILDRQARDRSISYERNKATQIVGTVSSDNPAINALSDDLFPKLAEGDRLLYCLRRDYSGVDCDGDETGYPWTPRASGLLLQYDDSATSEDGNSTFTAFDPWQYLYSIPVLAPNASSPLLHNSDVIYSAQPGDDIGEIVIDLLEVAEQWYNQDWAPNSGPRKMFLDWGWSPCYNGVIEPVLTANTGYITFIKGTSIGEAFDQLVQTFDFDISMRPIYDPANRAGILCELSIYAFMGDQQPGVQFSWDYSPWSVEQINRQVDGTGRANKINLHVDQGGPSVGIITEQASVNRFGEYWLEQFFIAPDHSTNLAEWAQTLKNTISEHPRTVNIGPLPERSPEPFIDWYLGDYVEVLASANLRATMSGFQRVQAFTLDISDDALETVRDLRVYIPDSNPNDT